MDCIVLKPIRKQYIWGFEDWCVSAHAEADCEVLNGRYAGQTLAGLWKNHRELFGSTAGEQYPLLTKVIEARDNLSIQVHPDDAYAAEHENGASGKNECWYILDCKPGTKIIIGHHAKNKEEMEHMIRNHEWQQFLREIPISKGDFFQIDAGCVHAIEGGTTILETQQNSDITYRVYDYDRRMNGKPRQLHVEQSIACIRAPFVPVHISPRTEKLRGGSRTGLISNSHYTIERYEIDGETVTAFSDRTFEIVSILSGSGKIGETEVASGMHVIIPAGCGKNRWTGNFSAIVATPAAETIRSEAKVMAGSPAGSENRQEMIQVTEKKHLRIGALEGGGTKMVCAVGSEDGVIEDRVSIPTEEPEKTIPALIDYFRDKNLDALGLAFFGPIDLNRKSPTYGAVTMTPKLAWRNYQVVGRFREALGIPVGFDTDVNGSMLGEATWGAARGKENAIYYTIGTGIGAGVLTNGKLLHGMLHPEAGHILLQKHPDDRYKGRCPYHPNCLEGLASGPAIEERWGDKAYHLSGRKEVWELEAYYIGQALVNTIMVLSPQIIILGGGVMHQEFLLPLIREEVRKQLGGYICTKETADLEHYIVRPALRDDQGIMGAVKIGLEEYERSWS